MWLEIHHHPARTCGGSEPRSVPGRGARRLNLSLLNQLIAARLRFHTAGMALLRDRNFLLLFAGQGISRLGDGLYTAAVAWLAWSLTDAPGAVALVTVAAYAPTFVAR